MGDLVEETGGGDGSDLFDGQKKERVKWCRWRMRCNAALDFLILPMIRLKREISHLYPEIG